VIDDESLTSHMIVCTEVHDDDDDDVDSEDVEAVDGNDVAFIKVCV